MAKKTKINLEAFLTGKKFTKAEKAFKKNFQMSLETTDARGRAIEHLCGKTCYQQFCKEVRASQTGARRCRQDRLRSLSIALETGQPYISICHAGIVLACVPIMNTDEPLGGLFFAKCLWDRPSELLIGDITKRLKGVRIDKKKLLSAINELPIVPGRKVHQAAEFLFVLVYEITGLDPHVMQWRRQRSAQQAQIGEFIQERKRPGGVERYPLDSERELIGKVKIGDRTGARDILNTILASIMLRDPGDINVLKARMVELLSILSRSAAEGGVDINFLLEKNLGYIGKGMEIDNQQDLCAWIGNALNDFLELVYSTQDSGRATQLKPAIEYIEQNYNQPIALSDVARNAHLSVSRLAHIFKDQMRMTIIEYVTNIRIDRARQLLLSTNKSCTEICFEVGYNNQSYFTRTFKQLVGVTPRQFREQNRR